jgi:hypothetical protein
MKSTNRRRAVAWFLTLSALGLGLSLGAGGCGTSASDICDLLCACQGCSEKERDQCLADGESAIADADNQGCSSEYSDYLACVEREAECRNGQEFRWDGCDVEKGALAKCDGGDACRQAATKLCNECNFSCTDPDPSLCNGQYECQSKCIAAATCEEIASQPPDSAYSLCLQGC